MNGGGGSVRRTAWLGRVELPAAVPGRTAAFYAQVFGWRAGEPAGGEAPYVPLDAGPPPGEAAGIGITTPQVLGTAEPLAVIHVAGEELAAVLARVEAAGGSVDLAPVAVGGHGTFARFRDPDGNLLGLWYATPAAALP